MSRHHCYRDGGCGPYEMLSCTECPASKPEYADRRGKRAKPASETSLDDMARIMVVKQGKLRRLASWEGRDADTVLADIEETREDHVTGLAEELAGLYLQADNKDQFQALFESLTGTSWKDFVSAAIAAIDETIAANQASGKDPRTK